MATSKPQNVLQNRWGVFLNFVTPLLFIQNISTSFRSFHKSFSLKNILGSGFLKDVFLNKNTFVGLIFFIVFFSSKDFLQ